MNAQDGYIGFRAQAEKGTFLEPTHFTKYFDDDLGIEGEPIDPGPQIGNGRDLQEMYEGPYNVGGSMNFDVRPEFLGLPLYGVEGAITSTETTGGVYQHVITPATVIPWFSVQKKVADDFVVFNYIDTKFNTVTLSCDAGGPLKGAISVMGLVESGMADSGVASYETAKTLMWHSGIIEIEDTEICPTAVNIEVGNNLEVDHRICSDVGREGSKIHEGGRDTSASLTLRPDDADDLDIYSKANYGEEDATSPQKKVYSGSASFVFESVADFVTGYKYSLTVDIPSAIFMPYKYTPSGSSQIEYGLNLRGVKATSSPVITFTLQNSTASYTA